MRAKAIKAFSSSYNGNVEQGQIIELPTHVALQMADMGMVELIRTSEKAPDPLDNGAAKQSVSSPAAPVSQPNKSSTSKVSAESSQSTPLTSSPRGVTQSTQQTESGGKDTTTKRRTRRKSGAATKTAKSTTDSAE